jgi:conjugative relaxase-like TrwC/TraI family protein
MLSVKPLASGGHNYYLGLVSVNYYLPGEAPGEPPGVWYGRGVSEFGLESGAPVEEEHLGRLCEGFHPLNRERLVWNAGRTGGHAPRRPGFDITLSVSKSLSILWAAADDELKRLIERVVFNAAKQTLSYLEEFGGFARIGKGGLDRDRVPLTFALFPQSSSRLNDMQLHVHCLLINAAVHPDGHSTAIDPTEIYALQRAGGALFNVALTHGLAKDLGIETVQRQTGSFINFEVAGLEDEALIEHYSKRKAEIDDLLEGLGSSRETSSGEMRDHACLGTRKGKDELPRGELIRKWREELEELFGITPEFCRTLVGRVKEALREEREELREVAFRGGIQGLEEQHSHWNLAAMHEKVSEHAQCRGLSVMDVREVIEHKLGTPELLLQGELRTRRRSIDLAPENDWKPRHYRENFEPRYTTPATLRAERKLLEAAERLANAPGGESPGELVEEAIARRPTIAPEQARAVRYLTSGPSLRLMTGDAGTGKTFCMSLCREIWQGEDQRRRVIGCAIAGKAAKQLESEANIPSTTLKSLLWQLDNGRLSLDDRTVVVCDEAAMVGTRMLARLVRHCEARGARLILLGDAKQVQSIEAGGGFRSLSERLGEIRLTEIRRQKEVWRREAVEDFGRGDARKALAAYLKRDQLHLPDTRDEAMTGIVSKWVEYGGRERPERVLMLASLNAEVNRLNKAAQAARQAAGELGPRAVYLAEGLQVFENDRVRFCQRTRKFGGIENGWSGTVVACDQGRNEIQVRLDVGRIVTVPLAEYKADKIKLSYASTVFSSQGTTVDVALVLLGGPHSDKHSALVAASRCRETCHLFVDAANAGPGLKDIIRQLSRDRTKTLARDVADEHQARIKGRQRGLPQAV